MDFHTLARRDLQALCKRNKIPANTTNVAMADALKALELVEGIEEFMQQSQSGTAQSSTESLEMDVTSPFVPRTAGRSTRRANIPKPAPESVNPITRTRRTTRKTQVNDADAIETPTVVPQTNRKKAPMASARLNMDAQLKECADEGKKDNLMTTPAVVTSLRKKVEESTVTRAYSTRRSVRLAVKGSAEVSNELSGISDGDAKTDVEEKSENKEEFEVVSIGKDEFEAVSDHKQDTVEEKDAEDEKCINFETEAEEIKLGSYAEEEKMCDNEEDMQLNGSNEVKHNDGSEIEITVEKSSEELEFETEAEEIKLGSYVEEEKMCDNEEDDMQLNGSNEVKHNDGSEIEITVEKSSEELEFEEGETTEDESAADDFVENVILDSGDNFVVDEFYFDNKTEPKEVEPTQTETLQIKADEPCADITEKIPSSDMDVIENEPTEIDLLEPEESLKAADFSQQIPTSDMDVNEDEPAEIEIIEPEESEKAVDFSEQIPTSDMDVTENEPAETEIIEPQESEKAVGFSEQIPTTMSSTVIVSDNKENILSGGSLVVMEDVKMTEKSVKLDEMSVRQLTKMLKEKLEITKKSSKTENDNEALMSRTALQAISDNRLVDGAGN